jgi:hypothetical protein
MGSSSTKERRPDDCRNESSESIWTHPVHSDHSKKETNDFADLVLSRSISVAALALSALHIHLLEMQRERVLNVRLAEEEVAMVKALTAHSGLKQSDTVRQLIRRAFDELPPKAQKKK